MDRRTQMKGQMDTNMDRWTQIGTDGHRCGQMDTDRDRRTDMDR